VSPAVERLLKRLEGVKRSGEGWKAKCLAHDDQHASLGVIEGKDGRAIPTCHAGCEREAILAKLGLEWRGLYGRRNGPGLGEPEAVSLAGGLDSTRARGALRAHRAGARRETSMWG
jgi:hypothetical protein